MFPLSNNGDVAGQSRAVERQVDSRRSLASVGRLRVVVCRAKHHELTNGSAVLVRKVLVRRGHSIVELVGLVAAHGRVAQRHLDELAGREDLGGVGAVGDDVDGQVETVGDLGVSVLVDGVVETGATKETCVGGVVVVDNTAGVVYLIWADLWGNDDLLANIGDDALEKVVSAKEGGKILGMYVLGRQTSSAIKL